MTFYSMISSAIGSVRSAPSTLPKSLLDSCCRLLFSVHPYPTLSRAVKFDLNKLIADTTDQLAVCIRNLQTVDSPYYVGI